MTPLEVICLGALGAGSALVLSETPWFRSRGLISRIRAYAPPTTAGLTATTTARSTAGEILSPLAQQVGERVSRAMGVTGDLGHRLERAGQPVDPGAFRVRELTHSLVGLAIGGASALATRPGPLVALSLVLGGPVLAVLMDEQRLQKAIADRARSVRLELPVIAEQFAILVAAGYSLPSSVSRLGQRGRGVVAAELQQVTLRIRSGASDDAALAEWAERSDLDSVRRLVGVLALHREAGDLGALIANEAESIRADIHRELIETIERRSQLVWIPVTVATLVPGLLFLAVPFVSALSQVTGGA